MAEAELEAAIRKAVKEHYADSSKPLLLSRLGFLVGDARGDIDTPLRRFIEDRLAAELRIEVAPDTPQKVAVAPPELVPRLREQLAGGTFELGHVSLPILIAFCKDVEGPDNRVFVALEPRHRYRVGSQSPGAGWHEVEGSRRFPGTFIGKPEALDPVRRREILDSVRSWAEDHKIPLAELRRERKESSQRRGTALERLVAAQRPEVRRQLVLPADIALLLSNTE